MLIKTGLLFLGAILGIWQEERHDTTLRLLRLALEEQETSLGE